MNNYFFRLIKSTLIAFGCFVAFATHAQDASNKLIVNPAKTYTVKPDYRKCAAPLCGGWFLTPVNSFSRQLETEDEAYQTSLLIPTSIYVASINFDSLGLTKKQQEELQAALYTGQALLRGIVRPIPTFVKPSFNQLDAQNAWISPNKNPAVGPYLNVTSSGIVCITTPCPYYKAELINTNYSSNFDGLVFEKAGLTAEEEKQAWQAVATGGLVLTGLRYSFEGFAGKGTGVSATKVFFAFPPTKLPAQ